jgi:hypothetical protein
MSKNFRFSQLDTIGAADAEGDTFFEDCFIDTGFLQVLSNPKDNRFIILGRTGSGKSALLLKLISEKKRAFMLNSENLSFSYISNSTILRCLLDLNVNLEMFFKLLWRHVLSVELLRNHFDLKPSNYKKSYLDNLFSPFLSNKKSKEAVDYLKKWGESFWQETDYRVKEITSNFVSGLETEIGVD